jgi:hypothetical protein
MSGSAGGQGERSKMVISGAKRDDLANGQTFSCTEEYQGWKTLSLQVGRLSKLLRKNMLPR